MPRLRLAQGRQSNRRTRFQPRLFLLDTRLTPSSSIPLNPNSWTSVCPAPISSFTTLGTLSASGRTTAVAADPTDANTIYIGAASGGVWKTTNANAANPTWTPLTDGQASLTTGDIALAPSNSSIVYVATGEP